MWRKFLKVRGLSREFYKVEVHNGKGTSFWYDRWSPLGCLMDMLGTRDQIDTGIRQHDTVHTAWTKRRRRVRCSEDLIQVENSSSHYLALRRRTLFFGKENKTFTKISLLLHKLGITLELKEIQSLGTEESCSLMLRQTQVMYLASYS